MERQIRPSLFYGTALSTLLGLAMGLSLHGPWQSHSGGPQILFASAAAAELARPLDDSDIIETAAPDAVQPDQTDQAYLDTDQLPPDPLPVVRLTRIGGPPIAEAPQVQEASLDTPPDVADHVAADQIDDTPAPPAGAEERQIISASYGQADNGR